MNSERVNFVKKCGELLRAAKPHLLCCKLMPGKDIENSCSYTGLQKTFVPGDEYVVVTCANGCRYSICTEGNSLCAIAIDIFSRMAHK